MNRKFFYIVLIFLCTLMVQTLSYAAVEAAGKAVVVKGKVERIGVDGKRVVLKEGSSVFDKDVIESSSKGSAKIVLKDMSEMSIGTSSQMTIDSYEPKTEKPGLFSLIVGQVRAKVVKSSEPGKTKLILRTPVATMGVRGTEFQAMFNSENKMSSLVTFEGTVAMTKTPPDAIPTLPVQASSQSESQSSGQQGAAASQESEQAGGATGSTSAESSSAATASSGSAETAPQALAALTEVLNDTSQTVMVSEGQFSGVASSQTAPTIPVKISPAQLESMKSSSLVQTATTTTSESSASASAGSVKKVISPIPPGVNAKAMVASASDAKSAILKAMGSLAPAAVKAATATSSSEVKANTTTAAATSSTQAAASTVAANTPPPEGFFDQSTGKMAPPAGGFVDIKTGLYIPPPPGSTFDALAGVYVPPPQMGSFDTKTGSYVPPEGMKLDAVRGFVAANEPAPVGAATSAAASASTSNVKSGTPGGSITNAPGTTAAQGSAVPPGTAPGGALVPPPPIGGMVFPGMTADMFGTGMTYAPAAAVPGAATNYISPVNTTSPTDPATSTASGYPYYTGTTPQYPVYDPTLCPPFCDPQAQPGQTTTTTTTTSATSTAIIKVN